MIYYRDSLQAASLSELRARAPWLGSEIPSWAQGDPYPGVARIVATPKGVQLTSCPGDRAPHPVTGKPRCELLIPREHSPFPEGVERWLGVTLCLNTKLAHETFVFQIHDAPKLGEPWSGWPSHPPLLALRHDLEGWIRKRSVWRWVYGADAQRQFLDAPPLEIGKPARIVVGFRGAANAGGFAHGFIGERNVFFAGPSHWPGAGASFPKFGLYCPPGSKFPMSITARDLVLASTAQEATQWK